MRSYDADVVCLHKFSATEQLKILLNECIASHEESSRLATLQNVFADDRSTLKRQECLPNVQISLEKQKPSPKAFQVK